MIVYYFNVAACGLSALINFFKRMESLFITQMITDNSIPKPVKNSQICVSITAEGCCQCKTRQNGKMGMSICNFPVMILSQKCTSLV